MKQPHALIIVDVLDISSLDFQQTLDMAGYLTELIVCEDVCLPQISRFQPDVIFLYQSLSRKKEPGFLAELHENDEMQNIPVIALVPDEDGAKGLRSLVSAVLVRPISHESLLGLLSSLDHIDFS